MIKTTNADSAGRNNVSGGMDSPCSADFPPAGGVWGGMRAGFGLGVFGNSATHNYKTDFNLFRTSFNKSTDVLKLLSVL